MARPMFIDMDQLRVGTFINTWVEGGERFVKFLPLNKLGLIGGYVTIRGLSTDPSVLREIHRPGVVDGSQANYVVLLSGENGRAWFLREYLGNILPTIMKQMDEVRQDATVTKQAVTTQKRIGSRSDRAVINEMVSNLKLIDQSRTPEDDRKRKAKPPSVTGG
jgi:hypothetical protein